MEKLFFVPDKKRELMSSISRDLSTLLIGQSVDLSTNSVEWAMLQENASSEGITGLLYRSLQHNHSVPLDVLVSMEIAYRSTQRRNIILLDELRRMLILLTKAGIPVIVLKGAVLSELIYGDIGLRPMFDIDLLVRTEQTEHAINILRDTGYQRASKPELKPGFDRRFRVEVDLRAPAPFHNQVDIHWQLLAPLFASRHVDLTAVWERAIPINLVGQPTYSLGPADWVLYQAAHAFYKHRHFRLLDLFDLDRLIRLLGSRLDWEAVGRIGADFHWLPALDAMLPKCVELLGTPIPPWIIQTVAAYRLPRFERWLLDWWLVPDRLEKHHIFPDWLTLESLPDRIKFIQGYLFPDRKYIEAINPGMVGWKLPYYYLYRIWHEMDESDT